MRSWGGLIGAVFLATACGASKTTKATSTGVTGAPAGAPCAENATCGSEICGAAEDGGSGNCCAQACGTDPLCGATACDPTGACIYAPAGHSCGISCADAILTPHVCNGSGVCGPATSGRCPDNFGCADAGGCNQACASPLDCAPGFTCKAGVCIARAEAGPCSNNFDCVSQICGASGSGNCCTAPCNSTLAPCGATACDSVTGACLYADAGTLCGSVVCAPGSQTSPTLCDGLGRCSPISCAPYLCGPGACQTSCTADSSSCSPEAFCDAPNSACCGGLVSGAAMAVDALNGSDSTPCCGFAGALPCRTLTHAMSLVAAAGVPNVNLMATLGSDGGEWPFADETNPITVGWGAELVAPGVYFEAIEISTSPNDGGLDYASIVGTSANPVVIGISTTGEMPSSGASLAVKHGNTLYIANARLYSSVPNQTNALLVAGGASLDLGQDQSGGVTGTVYVGDPAIQSYSGILCSFDTASNCTISDAPLQGMSSVVIQNLKGYSLYVDAEHVGGTPAAISLTSAPILGEPPSSIGFGKCSVKSGSGIALYGNAQMTLTNGTLQCLEGTALSLDGFYDAGPSVTMSHTTIQNATFGVIASTGNLTISSSNIRFNYVGVWQNNVGNSNAHVDLSGGALGESNTVICTNSAEAETGLQLTFPAIAVLNMTSATLNASNVSWDTPGPDQFICGPTGTMCACEIAVCDNPGGVDGMDAVNMSTGAITTTGNKLSNIICNPAPPAP
jgi:hypothetical protein